MLAGIKLYHRVAGFRGLLTGTIGSLVGYQRLMTIKSPDATYPIQLRVPSTDVATYEQIFISKDYQFDVRRPPRTIIDAGANVGFASVYLANRFPDASIYAVEPEFGNFELLKKNVVHYPNVVPVHAALWNKDIEISLVDPGLGDSGFVTRHSRDENQDLGTVCHRVRGVTVSTLMSEFDIEQIDILKIDIEGAESEVFSDTRAWINNVDAIIIELHDRLKAGCEQSFRSGTEGFDIEWSVGENVFRARDNGCLIRPAVRA